ncbi:hypothetical protein NX862_14170 [Rhodobacter sp. KR11]|uniref:hypothetical protein n=1 Tax=Rhodobacter sp. KR11 TaxID=2974588 RepID=UPI0022237964|nr:hypothetical protein [Rhodobacter sp. KR11]MCW1919902.1 hypothetical protein [Rhodobacter sp. KR11]
MALLEEISPDLLSRRIAAGAAEPEAAQGLCLRSLDQARSLTHGLKGSVLALAGQSSLAHSLRQDGMTGRDYLARVRAARGDDLLCFVPGG